MRHDARPLLHPMAIAELRPTQMTVGLREVQRKRAELEHLRSEQEREFLGNHMIPVVIGPKKRAYIFDNHHLTRALHDEGISHILTCQIAQLDHLGQDEFQRHMENRNWLRLYDADGARRGFDALPKSVAGLADDPYRSIAGDVRRAGGYAKNETPYAEFLWADHLRSRIKRKLVDKDYEAALVRAMDLVRERAADYLPGWCGIDN